MNPPIGLLTPVKAAIGNWLVQFRQQFYADTPAGVEWAARVPEKAMAWAPGRMVDQAEAMLESWRRNDNDNSGRGQSAYLPILLIATAPDWIQAPGESGRQVMDWTPFSFPDDTLKRCFELRTIGADLRTQVLVVASEPLTAMSILGQLCAWADSVRSFRAPYVFNGFTSMWPVVRVGSDVNSLPTPIGEQITALTMDLTFRVTMPMFRGPAADQPTDGQVPPGFPVLGSVANAHKMVLGPPTGVTPEEWAHFARLVTWSDGAAGVSLAPVTEPTVKFFGGPR